MSVLKKSKKNPLGNCPYCGFPIHYQDEKCPRCGKPNTSWVEPKAKQCGHCHEPITTGDKYCRYCGTKVGQGEFAPYQPNFQCVYGPMPVTRNHVCHKCFHTWSATLMVDDQKYCPNCGSSDTEILNKDDDGWDEI